MSFKVGATDEFFYAAPDVPGGTLLDFASTDDGPVFDRMVAMMRFLDQVLLPESAVRFAARLRSAADPITTGDVVELCNWLIGDVYGGRPTGPSSSSENGSSPTTSSSTDGAPLPASIL